jgi:mannose-6-phosphate isomerase
MVIALTDFECVCGFRNISSIRNYLNLYPEFNHLLKLSGYDSNLEDFRNETEALRRLFKAYMQSKEADSQFQLDLLVERLEESKQQRSLDPVEELILRLNTQFPGDNGVFAPLLLNYIVMKPGDSFFICANEPHAYIAGDCAECMALSDNVVRAGLTPKFKDVQTLCNMLTYRAEQPAFLRPIQVNTNTSIYRYCMTVF